MPGPPIPLQISYIDPDGTFWNFSDYSMANGYVCSAHAGIEGFPVMMQVIPMLDGTAVPNILISQPGTIGLAILVARPASDSQNDYYTLLDKITRAFWTSRNGQIKPGTLIVGRPDGTARQISTYLSSGMDTPDVGINDMAVYSFSLATPDPYWSDVVPSQLTFALPGASAGILPLLPVALNSSTVIGNTVISNKGNMLSYPTWTITGPGTPTITNNTTGMSWSMNTPVPGGQQVQVVTKRGGQMAVNLNTGANVWSQLVYASPRNLWPLVGGDNSVSITLAGATALSSVTATWTNRWARA